MPLDDDDRTRPAQPIEGAPGRADVPPAAGAASAAESLLRLLQRPAPAAAPVPAEGPAPLPQVPGYEVECELGRGGMGVVYKARQVGLNRTVALKMILASRHATPGEVVRFRDEAAAVAAIRHPNVVQVYELSPEGYSRPYFAMEYIAGGSLAAHLKANGPVAAEPAASLVAATADGLQAAHDAGLVHRDVKPGNILLANDEQKGGRSSGSDSTPVPRPLASSPKVSDFGLAKRLASEATRTQGPAGTPAYMAPEQAGGKSKYVGPGADVYALGAVLYECLTGAPPFTGEDQWRVIEQVLNAGPEPPRARAPGVPRDLELICLKCLEKDARHRYLSAGELAADLRRFLAGEPVSVRPVGPVTRAARWARRHPAPAALIALVALLGFAVPAAAVWAFAAGRQRAADVAAARQREGAARAEQGLADLARIEADKAAAAALKLADVRELFAIQDRLRTRAADRPLSWTYANRADLPRAVALAAGEPVAMGQLRSAAALALLSPDLKPLDPAVRGFTASVAATDPASGCVAAGEYLFWRAGKVRIVDPTTGEVRRELTAPAVLVDARPDGVRALAFSPDGTRLFVGLRSSTVYRFDLDRPGSGPAKTWRASARGVEQLAVSPNGKHLYGQCPPERPVFVWSTDTGEPVAKLGPAGEPGVRSFAVLPDGDVVASDDLRVRRWTAEHRLAREAPNPGAWRLAAAPGALLAGDGRNLDVYDRAALQPLDRFATPELRRGVHEESIKTIAVHPTGAFAATASGNTDRTVRVWELASGCHVGTVTAPGTGPIALAWGGDGRVLHATASGHLARWEFRTADAVRFACPSGQPLATAALLGPDRVLALTDGDGPRELLAGPAGGPATATRGADGDAGRPGIAVGPSGGLVLSVSKLGLSRAQPGGPVEPPGFTPQSARCPRFSPDGRTLWAVVDSLGVVAFDPETKKPRATWRNAIEAATLGHGSLDALAVGRTVVAAGGPSGSVHLLDPATERYLAPVSALGDPVLSLALSPDEAFVFAGTQSGKVRVIRLCDRAELPAVPAHPGGTTAVAVSRDGSVVATGGQDRAVRLWKRAGARLDPVLTVPDRSGPVRELQFAPDDDRLLVLIADERAVRVWDVAKLRAQLGRFKLAW
ncbi:MAG: protein kinase domain-containing protein [Gemmata sp.]